MKNILTQIEKNWVIICFIFALIVSWANINTRLAYSESQIANLANVVSQINQINVSIGIIQTQITDINSKIAK